MSDRGLEGLARIGMARVHVQARDHLRRLLRLRCQSLQIGQAGQRWTLGFVLLQLLFQLTHLNLLLERHFATGH